MTKAVYALVSDLFFATKIVKTAEALGVEARAFDHTDRLVEASREKPPALVFIDCEKLEREAFHLLEQFRTNETLSKIPRIGYLSHGAQDLKRQMREAGCEQVYSKSEFTKELDHLIGRYVHGFSSRL